MNYNEYYKRFEKNNLPTPFWDKERDTLEYVFYDDGRPIVSSNLCYSLEHITFAGFYYSYSCRHLTSRLVDNKWVYEVEDGHLHAHAFEEVVRDLYEYPEHFRISKEEEEFYSKQELQFLNRVQKYLLFIGVKDNLSPHKSVKRYRNPLQNKYKNIYVSHVANEKLKDVINRKIDFLVYEYYEGHSKDEDYKPKEYRNLLADDEGNIKLLVEFTKGRIKEYKDVKNLYKIKDLKDNDKVVVKTFKILEDYTKREE